MKRRDDDFVEDVETLLEQSVLEEATAMVWQTFETALRNLDEESLGLLREHFDGVPVKELSLKKNIPEKELEAWIAKAKREVIRSLRKDVSVKQ